MSTVSPSSQLVQVVPDSHHNTGDSSAKVKYEDLVRTDELKIRSVVEGVIDGKFEGGYLVTIKFGSQVLKGKLYHRDNKRPKFQPQETMGTPPSGMPPASQRPAKKRARVTTVVDSQKLKCHRCGYNFFPQQYTRLKPEYHGKERIVTKMIGLMWGNLSEYEIQVYQDKGVKDVQRYRTEMLEDKSAHEA